MVISFLLAFLLLQLYTYQGVSDQLLEGYCSGDIILSSFSYHLVVLRDAA